ncbi:cyclic nucleotide-binding domain-containing protein [Actinomadura sp. WMMB 499]|uniref:cyclic nucleotide-binding domain-containing protein n=1 Tax=Actinomadura sp. WMMB 499 TaxID=1219491 RepID=UPI0012445A71|nr:cyclic nucleotide-binding domain-containing protein [Actinomadura sp. WMMB 499]QFG21263.1 cyclic nucleotide-binding domain-containing protein [Actinomadura sp. WMMB 499]
MDEVTADDLARERFFADVPDRHRAVLAPTARAVVVPDGHRFFEEGGRAEWFWLVRSGTVALDLQVPGRGAVVVETLPAGSVVGWSWLFPPHRWRFGAVAVGPVTAHRFEGPRVRELCAADPALGYDLALRFGAVMLDRLEATRVRVLDLYARPEQVP